MSWTFRGEHGRDYLPIDEATWLAFCAQWGEHEWCDFKHAARVAYALTTRHGTQTARGR